MILREATPDDLRPLLALARKAWAALGIPFDTSIDRFRALRDGGFRIVVLWQVGAHGGAAQMTAALAAHRLETDRGPGYQIKLWVVDPDHADPLRALDAVALYACNLTNAEGRHIILSRDPKRTPTAYGRDRVGMDAIDEGPHVRQIGDARDIARRILQRRPEWRP